MTIVNPSRRPRSIYGLRRVAERRFFLGMDDDTESDDDPDDDGSDEYVTDDEAMDAADDSDESSDDDDSDDESDDGDDTEQAREAHLVALRRQDRELTAALANPTLYDSERHELLAQLNVVRQTMAQREAERADLDWAAMVVQEVAGPRVTHSRHTAASDWVAEMPAYEDMGPAYFELEAAQWMRQVGASVLAADPEEWAVQAHGAAARVAGAVPGGQEKFLQAVASMVTPRTAAGERRTLILPYSEVCMFMGVAGKAMEAELVGEYSVQLLDEAGNPFSYPITRGEAGWDTQITASKTASLAGSRFVTPDGMLWEVVEDPSDDPTGYVQAPPSGDVWARRINEDGSVFSSPIGTIADWVPRSMVLSGVVASKTASNEEEPDEEQSGEAVGDADMIGVEDVPPFPTGAPVADPENSAAFSQEQAGIGVIGPDGTVSRRVVAGDTDLENFLVHRQAHPATGFQIYDTYQVNEGRYVQLALALGNEYRSGDSIGGGVYMAGKTANNLDQGWIQTPSANWPGEDALTCPDCGSQNITMSGSSLKDYGLGRGFQTVECGDCGRKTSEHVPYKASRRKTAGLVEWTAENDDSFSGTAEGETTAYVGFDQVNDCWRWSVVHNGSWHEGSGWPDAESAKVNAEAQVAQLLNGQPYIGSRRQADLMEGWEADTDTSMPVPEDYEPFTEVDFDEESGPSPIEVSAARNERMIDALFTI